MLPHRRIPFHITVVLLTIMHVDAFSGESRRLLNAVKEVSLQRRHFLAFMPATLIASPGIAAMENNQKVFTAGQILGIPESKERFKEARKTLDYLIENYSEISKGGGDNVRRYLGTVGTTSALYGISKVSKGLQREAKDIIEYTENMSDFEYNLGAADTAVYSANFVEFSAASTKPEQLFKDGEKALRQARISMDRMAAELEL